MLSNTIQIITFDAAGFILESTDTLFSTDLIRSTPIYHHFPLLESISPILLGLKGLNHIPRIQIDSNLLSGVYDFYLRVLGKEDKKIIELTIEDRTVEYDDRRLEQQTRQEHIIEKQRSS